jgi:acyl-CoA reductase-like NAD-dependent aldehyde dehydrogenase
VGDGMQPDTQLGPLNNEMQFDRVNKLVADAK